MSRELKWTQRVGVPRRRCRWVTIVMPLRLGLGGISGVWELYMKDDWLDVFLSAPMQGGAWNPSCLIRRTYIITHGKAQHEHYHPQGNTLKESGKLGGQTLLLIGRSSAFKESGRSEGRRLLLIGRPNGSERNLM